MPFLSLAVGRNHSLKERKKLQHLVKTQTTQSSESRTPKHDYERTERELNQHSSVDHKLGKRH